MRKNAGVYSAVNIVKSNAISKTHLVSSSKTSILVSNFNLNFLMQAQVTVYRNFTKCYHFKKYMVKNTFPWPSGDDVLWPLKGFKGKTEKIAIIRSSNMELEQIWFISVEKDQDIQRRNYREALVLLLLPGYYVNKCLPRPHWLQV